MEPTTVTFPGGATDGVGRVLLSEIRPDGRAIVVTDTTPFHPVDNAWPDQPSDRGTLAGLAVEQCLTGAAAPDEALYVGDDIPVRRGEPDWSWVVVHCVAVRPGDRLPNVGDEVALAVDATLRRQLSLGHTATHVMALAMNEAAAPFWAKEVDRRDALGNPDLDAIAMDRSHILPLGARDVYRVGKSVRRKGLRSADLLDALSDLERAVDERLAGWIAAGGAVEVRTTGPRLSDRRLWVAHLPEGEVSMPCGGTHATDLAQLGTVTVDYIPIEAGFEAHTRVAPADR